MEPPTDPLPNRRVRAWEWILAVTTVGLAAALAYPWGYSLITGMLVGRPDGDALRLLTILFAAFSLAAIALASRPRLTRFRGRVVIAAIVVFVVASVVIVLVSVADTAVKWPASLLYVAGSLAPVWLGLLVIAPGSAAARVGALGVLAAILGAFLWLVRIDGLSGDAQVVFGWRHSPLPQVLSAAVASVPTAATSLEPGPNDFPSYLGPQRGGTLDRPSLHRDWAGRVPREVWRRRVGAGWGGFAVAGVAAITQEDRDGREAVVCYDLDTGTERWIHADPVHFDSSLGGPGPRGTPTIVGGRVYSMGATGRLNCLAADGSVHWKVDTVPGAAARTAAGAREAEPADSEELLPHGMAGSPLVVGGRVYVCPCGRDGRSLAAFDAQNGTEIFRVGSARASYASPMLVEVAGRPQVLVFHGEGCTAHDPGTGAELWSFPWTNDTRTNCAQPIVDGDRVLLSSGYGAGSVLLGLSRGDDDRWEVTERWRSRDLKSKFSTPVLLAGVVYGLDDGILAAIDLQTGRRLWKRGRYGHGQLLLVDDLLLVQTEGGAVALVEPRPDGPVELGRIECLSDKTWNTLALAGDLLFVRNSVEAACYRLPLAAKAVAAAGARAPSRR